MGKKIAVVLSGCGFKDGSEIHESVTTILAIVKAGAEPIFFAPDTNQAMVVNHVTGDTLGESRNVLSEAARIARGAIEDIKNLTAASADAVIFPGGFGAALNLCDFGKKGADCTVNPEVERVVKEFHGASKPLGLICIAPVIGAKVLGGVGVELTIGNDKGTAEALEKCGAKHVDCAVDDIHVDEKNRVVTTPAYMLAENIAQVDVGVSKLVNQIIAMM
ncbi:isoprenoid biosynthesis glyoxalase ElbB [Oligoflexia bacterium]|nr:isoprenoid biosynthesis glyoxalase ElbB [Oligoflexia bacterium]